MRNLTEILPEQYRQAANQSTGMSYEEYLQMMCDFQNQTVGHLTGHDCDKCKNKGLIFFVENGEEKCRECECMTIRRNLQRIKESGLAAVIEKYTFDTYQTPELWQQAIKQSTLEFLDVKGKWFYIGGQYGSGKTHICTAIVGELINRGLNARYMMWLDDSKRLKACINDDEEYYRLIHPLKTTDVLYIDDFFKAQAGPDGKMLPPTPADVSLAFEIINYRYMQPDAITIISSQYDIDGLLDIDGALGSRIYERTKGFCKIIGPDEKKNYRMRDAV